MRRVAPVALFIALLAGCSTAQPATSTGATPSGAAAVSDQRFPDIVDVVVTGTAPTFSFEVTVSSPYDTAERYADAFRVRDADGTVYGVTELTHDHASEQPFTRSLPDVTLPAGITSVVVEGRDRTNGWGGGTRTVDLNEVG
jgi:hypothetical protein